ncbi:MAG: site-specific integrase [Acidimicrobiales bacterium]
MTSASSQPRRAGPAPACLGLSVPAEELLNWLSVEKGRSPNTLAAYRRDLVAYEAWLLARSAGQVAAASPGPAPPGTAPPGTLGAAALGTASLSTAPLGTAPLGTAPLGTAPSGGPRWRRWTRRQWPSTWPT